MIRVYIICEGQSEEEFVNVILTPYLISHHIYDVRPILMTTSKGHKGGDVNYDRLKFNIKKLLKSEKDILVTTFIDFFRLKSDFPEFNQAQQILNKMKRVQFLEDALASDISSARFIPYIQLHEFEGLLFASKKGFEFLPNIKPKNLEVLLRAVEEKVNPEELNDGVLTAPSKRLEQLIPGFDKNKPYFGGIIAEVNSIESILGRCTRFNNWINSVISHVKQ